MDSKTNCEKRSRVSFSPPDVDNNLTHANST